MKDGKYGFVYITTNLVNDKKYIGQKSYTGKWKTYLGSGTIIKQAINKYGKENFQREIIEECKTLDELNNKEIYWINYYNAVQSDDFYNIVEGGGICPTFYGSEHHSSRKIICLNTLKIFDCIKFASDEYNCHRESIRKICENERHRTKNKSNNVWLTFMFYEDYLIASEDLIKEKLKRCKEGQTGSYNHLYGKPRSEEIKEKRRITLSSYNYNKKATKVICLTTKKVFDNIQSACNYYNLNDSGITSCCKDRYSYCGTYDGKVLIWMYYDEYLNDKEKVKKKLNNVQIKKKQGKRKVRCLNTNEIFESLTSASKWCNMKKQSNITNYCNGNSKYAGKHPITGEKLKWEYV